MTRGVPNSIPDPGFVYNQVNAPSYLTTIYRAESTKTPRAITINPAQKTLVMIAAGQLNSTDIVPTNYTPTNDTALDNYNPTTGRNFVAADPLLGTNINGTVSSGSANFNLRVADGLVTAGKFDRVIIVPVAVAGTLISQWADDNDLALYRTIYTSAVKLASQGVTPETPGVSFLVKWNQGESDNQYGTSQVSYETSFAVLKNRCPLLSGVKWTVARETWISGATSAVIQAAQAAVVDNVQVFAGEDMDSINASGRQADNTHLNDTGAAAAASLAVSAISAITF